MIELECLLYDNPTWNQVVEFFEDGEFREEHYLVAAIKKHLRTPEQKALMNQLDISIEDLLNGRVVGNENAVQFIFNDWNERLGSIHFGS